MRKQNRTSDPHVFCYVPTEIAITKNDCSHVCRCEGCGRGKHLVSKWCFCQL